MLDNGLAEAAPRDPEVVTTSPLDVVHPADIPPFLPHRTVEECRLVSLENIKKGLNTYLGYARTDNQPRGT